jgi:hypothetical protein
MPRKGNHNSKIAEYYRGWRLDVRLRRLGIAGPGTLG